MSKEYDLVVLGGGTGGYVAAIRAAQLGLNTAIVEYQHVGGTCLHKGCIPSKALLKSAEKLRDIKELANFGIKVDNFHLDFNAVQQRKEKVVETLHMGVQSLLKKNGVEVYNGYGRILGASIFSPVAGTISVEYENGDENSILTPKNVIIATGSTPRAIPDLKFDGEYILNSDHALSLDKLPEHMVIFGGGVIGIEWASLLTDLGVVVTIVEYAEEILPTEDKMIQQEMKKQLKKRGVKFYTNTSVNKENIQVKAPYVEIVLEDGQVLKTDKVLVSIGRTGNTEQIGLSNTNIQVEKGFIQTNEFYQTEESHIYAIGDCIGGMQLAHVATREGIIAVEHMMNLNPEPIVNEMVPTCIYSFPEAAKVGLTEEQANNLGYQTKVGQVSLQSIGKAHVNGHSEGYLKIISDEKTDDILGIHIIGDNATELISEASLAKLLDASVWEVSQAIHPHPTISESYYEAALKADGIEIHG